MYRDWELEEKLISYFYKCDNENCKEVIVTSGTVKVEHEVIMYSKEKMKEHERIGEDSYPKIYYPKIFYPAIDLFDIHRNTPDSIKLEVRNSFSLFWNNPAACVNSTRKVVERLLDIDEGGSPENFESADRRIKKSNYSPEMKEFFIALKWMGNDGTHQSDLLHSDAVTALNVLECCLNDLYSNRLEIDLKKIVKEVIEEKKSPSKHKQI